MAEVARAPLPAEQDFAAWSIGALAGHIIETHHSYLYKHTGEILGYAEKIAAVHGPHHPEVVEIARIFGKIAADMKGHLTEEEEVLFPAVRRIAAAEAAGEAAPGADREVIRASLAKLDQEHQEIGEAVHEIRRLSAGYQIPEGVCNTYVVTYRLLEEFEEDLHKHVHLENNLLFPKAARL